MRLQIKVCGPALRSFTVAWAAAGGGWQVDGGCVLAVCRQLLVLTFPPPPPRPAPAAAQLMRPNSLVQHHLNGKDPSYLVVAGIVFTAVTGARGGCCRGLLLRAAAAAAVVDQAPSIKLLHSAWARVSGHAWAARPASTDADRHPRSTRALLPLPPPCRALPGKRVRRRVRARGAYQAARQAAALVEGGAGPGGAWARRAAALWARCGAAFRSRPPHWSGMRPPSHPLPRQLVTRSAPQPGARPPAPAHSLAHSLTPCSPSSLQPPPCTTTTGGGHQPGARLQRDARLRGRIQHAGGRAGGRTEGRERKAELPARWLQLPVRRQTLALCRPSSHPLPVLASSPSINQVHKFNGEKVRNLRHLAEMVAACKEPQMRFDVDYSVRRREAKGGRESGALVLSGAGPVRALCRRARPTHACPAATPRAARPRAPARTLSPPTFLSFSRPQTGGDCGRRRCGRGGDG